MIRAALVSVLLLSACTQAPQTYRDLDQIGREYENRPSSPANADEATRADTCGMARFQHLIGVAANTIDPSTLPPRARIITPETMVTQDFSPGRLNIMTGTDGRVSSLRCF